MKTKKKLASLPESPKDREVIELKRLCSELADRLEVSLEQIKFHDPKALYRSEYSFNQSNDVLKSARTILGLEEKGL